VPKTVLIVEDYEDIRSMLKYFVERADYNVIEAEDGYGALEALKHDHPDLIFMDLAMPGLDGFATTQIIRSWKEFADIPIIGLTSFDRAFHEKGLESGCTQVYDKSTPINQLKGLLQLHLAWA
jgi:two-component system, cell cycle response regulator DivK